MLELDLDRARIIYTLLVATPVLWAIRTYSEYRTITRREGVREILGPVTLLPAGSVLSMAFSSSSRFALGYFQFWLKKREWYKENGRGISLFPRVLMTLLVGDPLVFKQITSSRTNFPKPAERYALLTIFGPNLVASEGEMWKKYRKICAPAFSERNNRLVWESSVRVISDFIETAWGWPSEERVFVEDLKVNCTEPELSIEETFDTVSNDINIKLLLPAWFLNNSELFTWGKLRVKLDRIKSAFTGLTGYLHEMIDTGRNSGFGDDMTETKADLFSNLLKANMAEEEEMMKNEGGSNGSSITSLSNQELIGNIFVFLFAGHETTAHTLCFALHLLALYPEEQQRLYDSIAEVCPNGRLPTYEDLPHLTRAMAVLYETLRLFPAATNILKKAAEDTSLVTTNEAEQTLVVPVPEETLIVLHIPGVHYDPRYWEDPDKFNPDRFMPGSTWNREAFVPFSAGQSFLLGMLKWSGIDHVHVHASEDDSLK
ncbi:cytochrome P450 [Dendrothele bispora CBS 962.96]|uniref:Cytochrome P450 n=1 Tax=Dendrothele bispora (strain CBS 962.96) TaxID=1314807 RepID=A0A4S8KKZ7_DENBC|nr:cytochrome P450 [Dendrothele bispora CBS 962.96]